MRDTYLERGIDGVTVLLGIALAMNGVVEFVVLNENFDQFGGLIEKWMSPIFLMVFGALMILISLKKNLVLVYFTWFASHFGRAIWNFYIASLLISLTRGQGYVDPAPWTHFLTASLFGIMGLFMLILHFFVERVKIAETNVEELLAKPGIQL